MLLGENNMKNNVSFKVSLGGIVSALCLVSMFLTGIMPMLAYTLPALAGALLIIIVIEINMKWAFVTYASVGLLSIFITPDKEAAILFVLFLGYYPVLKSIIEKIKNRYIEWIVKLLCFNFSVIIAYTLIINVFGMMVVFDEFGDFGQYTFAILLALANIVFVIYDIALTKAISSYINWLRPKILRRFR